MTGRLHGTEITEDERRTLLWIAGMERSSARNIAATFDKTYLRGYMDGVEAAASFVKEAILSEMEKFTIDDEVMDAVKKAGLDPVKDGESGAAYGERRERVYDE